MGILDSRIKILTAISFLYSGKEINLSIRWNNIMALRTIAETTNGKAIIKTLELAFVTI